MGIPCIVNKNVGDLDGLFQDNTIGYQVNSFDDREYEKSIRQISMKIFDKVLIRQIALDNFSLTNGVK